MDKETLENIAESFKNKIDDELFEICFLKNDEYEPEVIKIAEAELKNRGISEESEHGKEKIKYFISDSIDKKQKESTSPDTSIKNLYGADSILILLQAGIIIGLLKNWENYGLEGFVISALFLAIINYLLYKRNLKRKLRKQSTLSKYEKELEKL